MKWRYKCPGCGIKSCSIQCINQHKNEVGCNGKRSKTKYVPLSNFTTSQLLSDYHFLEETGRVIGSGHRSRLAISRDNNHKRQRLHRLQSAARKKGISLHLLPQGMLRHEVNTSRAVWNRDRKQWRMEWRLKLVFPQAGVHYIEQRVCEYQLLGDILKKYVHPTESDPVIRHRLKCYVNKEYDVLLKLKRQSHTDYEYSSLHLECTLSDCLRQQSILEFPELCIILSSHMTVETQMINEPTAVTNTSISSLSTLAIIYGSSDEDEHTITT